MVLGKHLSRTSAIASGHDLINDDNCQLGQPGDAAALAKSLRDVLGDDLHARALGASAHVKVDRGLTWNSTLTASRKPSSQRPG